MSKKKASKAKVKAPLSYDPGKGRPKEHLAYLNWQEMEALKRLNGNNMERGPKGLPSFPPADATGGSYNSGYGGAASKSSTSTKSSTSSSTSRISGGISGSNAANYKSTTGSGGGGSTRGNTGSYPSRGNTGGQRPSSFNTGSGGGGNRGVTGSGSSNRGVTSMGTGYKGKTTGQTVKDAVAKATAETRNTVKAAKNQSVKIDASKPSSYPNSMPGSRVTGAIDAVKKAATQPRDMQGPIPKTVSPNQYGWSATGPSMLPAHQGMGIYGGDLAAQGRKFSQQQIDTLMDVNTYRNPQLNEALKGLSPKMRTSAAALSSSAKLAGVDPAAMIGLGAVESHLGTLKNRPGSQYRGLTQMGDAAWNESANKVSKALGRDNVWGSAQAATAYAKKNIDAFTHKFGRAPTAQDVYGMHQQGFGGYSKLTKNPNAPAYKAVGYDAVYKNLPGWMRTHDIAKTITGRQFASLVGNSAQQKLAALTGGPSVNVNVASDAPRPTARPDGVGVAATPSARPPGLGIGPDPFQVAGARPEAYSAPPRDIADASPTVQKGEEKMAALKAAIDAQRFNVLSGLQPTRSMTPPSALLSAPKSVPLTSMGISPGASMRPPQMANMPPAPSVKTAEVPARPDIDKAPTVQPGADVLAKADAAAKKAGTKVENVYSINVPGLDIDPEAKKQIASVLKNPDKIYEVAKEGDWSAKKNTKALTEIKNGLNDLKKAGAKVNPDGSLSIPANATKMAQNVYNKLATAYNSAAPLSSRSKISKTFKDGLGQISKATKQKTLDKSIYNTAARDFLSSAASAGKIPSTPKSSSPNTKLAGTGYGAFNAGPALAAAEAAKASQAPSVVQQAQTLFSGIGDLVAPKLAEAATTIKQAPVMPSLGYGTFNVPSIPQATPTPVTRPPNYDVSRATPAPNKMVAAPIPRPNPLNDPTKFEQARKDVFAKVDARVLSRLVGLQDKLGVKLTVTSGFRDPEHNKKVGGVSGSQHIPGNAVDVKIQNATPEQVAGLVREASKLGFTGIGVYNSGKVHLDIGSQRVWGPDTSKNSIGKLPGVIQDALNEHMSGNVRTASQQTDNYPLTSMGTAARVVAPQLKLSPAQLADYEARQKRAKLAMIGAGTAVTGSLTGGRLAGKIADKLSASKKAMLDNYVLATPEQKLEMEKRNPELIGWGRILGIDSVSPYSDYQKWADRGGLRAPQSREGGGGGIRDISDEVRAAPTESTKGTAGSNDKSDGSRPYQHYLWDLGVDIPSPGSPKYPEYLEYLKERMNVDTV